MADFEQTAGPDELVEANGGGFTEPEPDQAEPLTNRPGPEAAEEVEVERRPRGLYLVRIPKPPIDEHEAEKKRLQAEFQDHVAKLKELNAQLAAKRSVVQGFKRDMDEARDLKGRTEPEYQQKNSRMQELRKVRDTYIELIDNIRMVSQLEHQLAHEGLPLREEKQAVQQIAKLKAKVPNYETQKNHVGELEAECKKIKDIIKDMETEFGVIRTEHAATSGIVKDIGDKLKKAQLDVKPLQDQQAELTKAKDVCFKALEALRTATNDRMEGYRDNRRFSLTVRDMVAANPPQIEDASRLVDAQVEELISQLTSDKKFCNEYMSLWAAQRRFPVAEVLPKSCLNPQEPARPAGGRGGTGGRGGAKAAPAPRAPPPQPRGAEKAQQLIDKLLQEASQEAAARARGVGGGPGSDGDADVEEEQTPAPAAAKKAEPYKPPAAAAAAAAPAVPGKLVQDPAAAAKAAFKEYKVELPKVAELAEFVPPVIKSEQETVSKEALREEQARKAAEAEERKRRRAEQAERKRLQAAEAAKRLEAERRERDAAARAAAAERKAAAQQPAQQQSAVAEGELSADAGVSTTEQGAGTVATAVGIVERVTAKAGAPKPFEKKQMMAAAKRPKPSKATPQYLKIAKNLWYDHQGLIIFGAVMLLCIILSVLFLMK